MGTWLNAGDEVLQIDDTRNLEARIEIPQGDIDLVRQGETVRLRSWSERSGDIAGRVIEIAPEAKQNAFGIPRRDNELVRPAPNSQSRTLIIRNGEAADRSSETAAGASENVDADVVRVYASIVNPAGLLIPGMRGFAKLGGREMQVWSACLRLFIRFFTVQIWSWIP
jgi:hypothetical protein